MEACLGQQPRRMGVGKLEKIKGVARKVSLITAGRDRDKRQPRDTDSRRIQLGGQTPREEGLLGLPGSGRELSHPPDRGRAGARLSRSQATRPEPFLPVLPACPLQPSQEGCFLSESHRDGEVTAFLRLQAPVSSKFLVAPISQLQPGPLGAELGPLGYRKTEAAGASISLAQAPHPRSS